jgi:hypothetical protein
MVKETREMLPSLGMRCSCKISQVALAREEASPACYHIFVLSGGHKVDQNWPVTVDILISLGRSPCYSTVAGDAVDWVHSCAACTFAIA